MKRITVFILLLLISCTQNNTVTNTEIYKGDKGVSLEIIDKSLPSSIYEKDQFNMNIKLTNLGAIEISPSSSILKITLEKGYMEFDTGNHLATENFELKGKERFSTLNDWVQKQFTIKSLTLDDQSQSHDTIILATICYDYMTKAFADICIDTDIYNIKPVEKTCSAEVVSLSGGQGAPVSVVSVEPKMLGDENYLRPQFIIKIRNTDEGSVIQNINVVCSSQSASTSEYDNIELSDLSFSQYKLNDFDCTPNDNGRAIARLRDEEAEIVCTLKEGKMQRSTPSYKTPLYVELKYAYTLSKSKQVTVESMPK